MPEVGDALQRLVAQAVHQHREDAAGGRLPVGEAQVQRAEAELAARACAPCTTWPLML